MGYSPTEYAEFTEPPAEKSLPRISQICTDVRVRCSPTEFTEFTEPPTEMSSHGFHRFTQILRVRCSPTEFTEYTEFGSVGMAGMPYPPTSVRIRVICGRLYSARSFREFRAFCGNIFSPTDFTDLHICTPWAGSVGMAGMPYPPNLCASVSSVGVLSLQEVLCIRCIPWELLHRLFGWCSSCSGKRQSRAETAAPPGGIHGSSVQISPPHISPSISPQTLPSACPPSTVGTTSSPPAAR